ncbi:MAG: tyrosine-type recombinase/integrase [Candidatus Bathyarchaeia archaeon]|nr:tyrosine-type recombinase/integrase [Candidatus Bathyarchaeia archaeon]
MSNKLTAMFSRLPKTREKVFSNLAAIRTTFYASRKHAAEKLNNPRLMQIHFHTFRHWKATTLYHQTKDILYVKRFLGHRCIKNTEIYINLEQALFRTEDAEYISNATVSIKGARVLIEAGFGYVTEMNGVKLFRKRK